VRAIKGLRDIRTRQGWEWEAGASRRPPANLNKRRSWTPCIRMRHSIPREAAHDIATWLNHKREMVP
jgi:hypothetical protein